MKPIVWFAAILLLAVPGTIVWRVPLVARMSRGARWALAWVAGVQGGALLLYVYALAGLRWTRASVAIPWLIVSILSRTLHRSRVQPPEPRGPRALLAWTIVALFLTVTIYALADARATCGDLIYIWAPKAQAFDMARTIDTTFLAYPFYFLMHPDYPPLVPLTFDIGSMFAHRFSWWPPLFLSPVILLCIIGALRGFGGTQRAAAFLMAVLSFAFVAAYLPGAADPFLLLFESIAVIALTFARESRDARWIAAAALAGATFSKVEGATFAIIAVIGFLLTEQTGSVPSRLRRAAALALPATALLGSWLLFAWRHKLLDQYARAHGVMFWDQLSTVVNDVADRASYKVYWLPWLAAAAPLLAPPFRRRALFPLLVAGGSLASTFFFYLHDPHPAFWIATSAERILVTPMMCIAVASASTFDVIETDGLADAAVVAAA